MVMAEYVTRNRTPIKVGFYDIVRTIGRGNFAVVKLARHRITKTEVAIKIIDKLRLDQLNLKKIYREIQILKLLNHQHIIKLYQVMETSSTIYLVCEYARNGELFDYITEQGRLPEAKAKKMFWQVLTAVEYCHKNNVVHRDLKAENLLLDSSNNIKLADFGFSNFYQSGSMLSTWCGSPPYAAPEVFEGKLYDGPHLDVWSLGVVLYVLVCGTFPFDGSNLATLKDRVLGGRFRIPYWMSQDCENLVRHMLVINPKKRLTISQIKKHTWMQECNPELALPQSKASPSLPRRGKLSEYNEHVLKIMQGLGINRQKTLESLSLSAYDHLYAIYHLLADRLKLHRTSFPLEENISYDTGRRRPSNVADQAVCSMTQIAPMLPIHQEQNDTVQGNAALPSSIPDVKFEDMTAGLPTVPHSLNAPVRYSSPPLPQIRTSMYDETTRIESTNTSQGSPPNPTYMACQHEENLSVLNNNPNNSSFRTPDYHQGSMDNEEPNLRNYNLHQRRHTLMVPNPSQIQMLRAGMETAGQISPQHSPHTSTIKLCHSGEEMSQHNFPANQFLTLDSPSNQKCEGSSCNNRMCGCRLGGINFTSNKANLLLPCKTLPTAPDFSFNSHKVDARPQMRRKSGAPAILTNLNLNDAKARERESQELKAAFIIQQRQQLDSSPIGFRQGRRASDGLLLLGDNMLKEHWQKLARTSGVPEMTSEDPEETLLGGHNAPESNRLQLPLHNQVNRTKSAERNFPPPQSSPGSTPGGSGSNISYQPYNNNQSLARRRSLHAQNIQIRGASPTLTPNTEAHGSMIVNTGSQPPQVHHQQQPYATKIPSPLLQDAIERPAYIQTSNNDNQAPCQWSSWKSVKGNSPEGNQEVTPTMWQKLSMAKSGTGWNENDFGALSVASDEAVSSKAAAAQEQQRDSKPIRQQSLPISPTNNNHPFGSGQQPTMAQILQQRRLQRKLKVAATHQQMIPGYQLPLPELEQLKIDNSSVFGHLQALPPNSSATDSIPQSHFPTKQPTEQEYVELWNQQYATSMAEEVHSNAHNFSTSNNKDVINFEKTEQFDESNYQGFCGPTQQSNPIPIALIESKGNSQFSWSYDMPPFHYKSFEFDSSIITNENLSNSAERLEHAGSETMEFVIY